MSLSLPCVQGEPVVHSECLSFARIPHTTPLFLDFLYHFDKVREFYPQPPLGTEWISNSAREMRYDDSLRQQVAGVLERQNRHWGASTNTLENIGRFRDGAQVVVTGHQVGLFGGPLFTLLKAVSLVRLVQEAERVGVPAVPVFWLATEDHDLAEVNHVVLPDGAGGLRTLATKSHGAEGAPMSEVPLEADIAECLAAAEEVVGGTEVMDWLREAYQPGRTMGEAFAVLLSRIFADFGIILLDPSDPELHRLGTPIFRAAIEHAEELDKALIARGKQLQGAGYHEQVKVTPSSTLLFTFHEGARTVIRRANGDFTFGGQKVSRDVLLAQIDAAPETFSANVLLRPVLQDYLLPTLGYIGGPAEVAYFAQVGVVYEKLLGRITPALPRFSATLLEPHADNLLKKYELNLTDCFHSAGELKRELAKKVLPPDLRRTMANAAQTLDATMMRVKTALTAVDPTLTEAVRRSTAKMTYQLEKLRTKAASAELRRNEVLGRHAAQISSALFPDKALQERLIGGIYFLARHGRELLPTLVEAAQVSCPDHQVIHL
jgi:bacillithiol biosynthesis cysteine-adding enzyme BshC